MSPEDLKQYRAPEWRDLPDLDLYMDQVISVLEKELSFFFGEEKVLTSTMINNYVKNRLLPPPINKKYTRLHLARLFEICVLKSVMQLSEVDALLNAAWRDLKPEEAHDRFCRLFSRAVTAIFNRERTWNEPTDPVETALSAVCLAAAGVVYARFCLPKALQPKKEKAAGPEEEPKEAPAAKAEKKKKKNG